MARAIISGINGAAGHGRIFHRLVHRSSTRNFVGGGGGKCKRGKRGEGRKSKEEHNAYNYGKRKFSKSL